jgi:hypothetical protein
MMTKWLPLVPLLLAGTLTASAQVPTMMSYQGRLSANGTNFNGTARFKFSLVSPDGFTTYWSNDNSATGGLEPMTNVAVAVSNGLFTVFLGDTTLPGMSAVLDPAIFQDHDDAYLRIWVSDGASAFIRLTPDQPLGSVGYAMMAATAAGVAAGAVGVDQLAAGAVTSNKIDWSTMPAIPDWKGYDESIVFDIPPTASGENAIALGSGASADGSGATVGGGLNNTAGAVAATVGGGSGNSVIGRYALVAGGLDNQANGLTATVGGGEQNSAGGESAKVGGGKQNSASARFATVSGGRTNIANNNNATVGGGEMNIASGAHSTVGGGSGNSATAQAAAVGGGEHNVASQLMSTVGGGENNLANGGDSTVGGGSGNRAIGWGATVGGGLSNFASNDYSTVGGGEKNIAEGIGAAVGGGTWNVASGSRAVVGGGTWNVASGYRATIPGGAFNSASAELAFAAGYSAKANHKGCFVWGDSTDADVASASDNSVTFRAAGGYRLFSDSGLTLGAQLLPNATAWSALSDRNAKENFEPINTIEILEKVAGLPLTAWNYKADPEKRRYIGPVAQDFHSAFGLGDDTSISTLDADGVALAAIQALGQKVAALEAENAELKARLELVEGAVAP